MDAQQKMYSKHNQEPWPRAVTWPDLTYLLELVHSEDASRVPAVGANLLPEAVGYPSVPVTKA